VHVKVQAGIKINYRLKSTPTLKSKSTVKSTPTLKSTANHKSTSSFKSTQIKLRLNQRPKKEVKVNVWPKIKREGFLYKSTPTPLHFRGISPRKRSHSQGGKNYSQVKGSPTNLKLPLYKRKTFKTKTTLSKRRETFEDSKWRSSLSSPKSALQDRDWIRGFCSCSFVTNSRDLCNTYKFRLFTNLWLQILTRLVGQSQPLISFFKIKTSKSKHHFFQRSHGYQKRCLSSFEENTGAFSRRPCQNRTIPKRQVYGMQTRSMVKATTVVTVRQTMAPSPKQ